MLEAYKERDNGNYNFSLCLLVGKEFTWHAEGLKENIIEKFSKDTYREWKEVFKKPDGKHRCSLIWQGG